MVGGGRWVVVGWLGIKMGDMCVIEICDYKWDCGCFSCCVLCFVGRYVLCVVFVSGGCVS